MTLFEEAWTDSGFGLLIICASGGHHENPTVRGGRHDRPPYRWRSTCRTADLDWTYLSPAALIAPGERTGKYRTGVGPAGHRRPGRKPDFGGGLRGGDD